MSLETWKAEFYPIDAKDCPAEQAIAHSLRKWEGLTGENSVKHGVSTTFGGVRELGEFGVLAIDGSSCALCAAFTTEESRTYIDAEGEEEETKCGDCPLMAHNDGIPCDVQNKSDVVLYHDGLKNPLIMIEALRATLKENS